MADTTTPTPESGNPGEAKSSGTAVGPGRPPARRAKAGRRNPAGLARPRSHRGRRSCCIATLPPGNPRTTRRSTAISIPVSSRVSGYVTRVTVDDNQYVEAGTVLVQLDPKDYEVALANAKATLANDQASAAALQTNVPLTSVNTSSRTLQRSGRRGERQSRTGLPPSGSLTPRRPRCSRPKPMT